MKFTAKSTNNGNNYRSIFLLLLLSAATAPSNAQSSPPGDLQPYASFSPPIAVIVVVIIAALFFLAFFSIYIRHRSDTSGVGLLSMRSRRAATGRGLDKSVIETFPTFSYSEVKNHQIGKGVLECAVCLNEFEDDETLRLIPKCDHVFHPECIDAWLESHVTCPVCRADLAQKPGDEPVQAAANVEVPTSDPVREADVAIEVVDDAVTVAETGNRNETGKFNREARSWSVRNPTGFNLNRFRSHSTGHSVVLVQPVQNLERFTLRVPAEVRKEVMNRAEFNRARSLAVGGSRKGNRNVVGEGSSRWNFFTRALSIRSPRVAAEGSVREGSSRGGGRTPVKMPSFKCLEPKTGNSKDESPV